MFLLRENVSSLLSENVTNTQWSGARGWHSPELIRMNADRTSAAPWPLGWAPQVWLARQMVATSLSRAVQAASCDSKVALFHGRDRVITSTRFCCLCSKEHTPYSTLRLTVRGNIFPEQQHNNLGFRHKESEATEAARNPARGEQSPRCLRAKPCRAGPGYIRGASATVRAGMRSPEGALPESSAELRAPRVRAALSLCPNPSTTTFPVDTTGSAWYHREQRGGWRQPVAHYRHWRKEAAAPGRIDSGSHRRPFGVG